MVPDYFKTYVPGIFAGIAQNLLSVNVLHVWSAFVYYQCASKGTSAGNYDEQTQGTQKRKLL